MKTWKERILDYLGEGKWRTYGQIAKALGLNKKENEELYWALSSYLLRLIRSGHVERAKVPERIKKAGGLSKVAGPNYAYRRTKKKYVQRLREEHYQYLSEIRRRKKVDKETE